MSKKHTNKTSPVGKAYIFSVLGFLIPAWTGSGLATNSVEAANNDPYFIAALVCFGIASFGPSIGLIYLGKKAYGFFSGLGRIVFMGGIIAIDMYQLSKLPDGQGHAYLSFLAIMLAFVWGTIDFVLIGAWAGKTKK